MSMYIIVRFGFIVTVLVVSIIIGMRMKSKKKGSLRILSVVTLLFIILGMVSMYFPVENLFVRFSTVEDAVRYYNGTDIALLSEGENSCGVYVQKNKNEATYSWICIPKDEKGYTLPPMYGMTDTLEKRSDDGRMQLTVYDVKNSNDCYVSVTATLTDLIESAENNLNTQVTGVGAELGNTGYIWYIFLTCTDNNPLPYTLYLDNGEVVTFE